MSHRKSIAGFAVLALAAFAGWLAWDRLFAPSPPQIPLEGATKERIARIEKAREEVRRQPRSAKAWGELSMVLMGNAFFEQAIPCFAQAQRLDPEEPRWPYFQGALSLIYGRREGFVKLKEALALARSNDDRRAILLPLIQALVEDGQLDEAETRLRELREIEGDSPAVHFCLGILAVSRDDRAAAQQYLSKLTEHPSARKRACSLLAGIVEDEKLAQEYRRRAAELGDDQPWPGSYEDDLQSYRADPEQDLAPFHELVAQKRLGEALAFLRKMVDESPSEAACMLLGVNLMKLKDYDEGAKMLRRATEFNPRNVKAHLFLGTCLLEAGKKRLEALDGKERAKELFRQAVAAEDKALALQNQLAYAHLTRGQALKYLGRTEEALTTLRQAALIAPEIAEMHLVLGEALGEAGQLPEALQHLEDAVRIDPQGPAPRETLEKWRTRKILPK